MQFCLCFLTTFKAIKIKKKNYIPVLKYTSSFSIQCKYVFMVSFIHADSKKKKFRRSIIKNILRQVKKNNVIMEPLNTRDIIHVYLLKLVAF